MPRRYVLNSAVLTAPGRYEYVLIRAEEAKKWLESGAFISALGHPETAKAISSAFGVEIPVSRAHITMECGDEALIIRLKARAPTTGEVAVKLEDLEFGILRRIA